VSCCRKPLRLGSEVRNGLSVRIREECLALVPINPPSLLELNLRERQLRNATQQLRRAIWMLLVPVLTLYQSSKSITHRLLDRRLGKRHVTSSKSSSKSLQITPLPTHTILRVSWSLQLHSRLEAASANPCHRVNCKHQHQMPTTSITRVLSKHLRTILAKNWKTNLPSVKNKRKRETIQDLVLMHQM
jgi:hypothetical protein